MEQRFLATKDMMIWGEDMTQEVNISESRKIVIKKRRFREQDTLDVRTWLETENYSGFTKKGINIPLEKGKELAEAILKELKE
jgi:hypothetical protein